MTQNGRLIRRGVGAALTGLVVAAGSAIGAPAAIAASPHDVHAPVPHVASGCRPIHYSYSHNSAYRQCDSGPGTLFRLVIECKYPRPIIGEIVNGPWRFYVEHAPSAVGCSESNGRIAHAYVEFH